MAEYWKRIRLTQQEYDGVKDTLNDEVIVEVKDSFAAPLAYKNVQFAAVVPGGSAPDTASYLTSGDESASLPNSVNLGAVGTSGSHNLLVNTPSGGVASLTGLVGVPGTVLVTNSVGDIGFSDTVDTLNTPFVLTAGTSSITTTAEDTYLKTGSNLLTDANIHVTKAAGIDILSPVSPINLNSPIMNLDTGTGTYMSLVTGAIALESTISITETADTIRMSNGASTPEVMVASTGISATTSQANQNIEITTNSNTADINITSANDLNLTATNALTYAAASFDFDATSTITAKAPTIKLWDGVGNPSLSVSTTGITGYGEGHHIILDAGSNGNVGITSGGTGITALSSATSNLLTAPNITMSNGGITPSLVVDETTGITGTTDAKDIYFKTNTSGNFLVDALTGGTIVLTSDTSAGMYSPYSTIQTQTGDAVQVTTGGVYISSSDIYMFNQLNTPTFQINNSGITGLGQGNNITFNAGTNANIALTSAGSGTNTFTSAVSTTVTSPVIQQTATTSIANTSPSITLSNGGGTPSLVVNSSTGITGTGNGHNISMDAGTNGSVSLTSDGTGTNTLTSAVSNTMVAPICRMSNGGSTPVVEALSTGVNVTTSGLPIAINSGTNGNISLTSAGTGTNTLTSATSNLLVAPTCRMSNGGTTPKVETLSTGVNVTTSGLPIAVNSGTNGNISLTSAGTGTNTLTSAVSNTMVAPICRMSNGGSTPVVEALSTGVNVTTSGLPIAINSGTNGNISLTSAGTGTNTITSAVSTTIVSPSTLISNGGTTPAFKSNSTQVWMATDNIGASIILRNSIAGNSIDLTSANGGIGINSGTAETQLAGAQIAIANIGNGTGTTLVRNAANRMVLLVSSMRYKEKIEYLEIDTSKMFDLIPRSFNYISEPENRTFGWIAEETYNVLPELVNLNAEGQPESINYANGVVLLLEEVRKLKTAFETTSAQYSADISALTQTIDALTADNTAMKADISSQKTDISTLQADNTTMKADILTLQSQIAALQPQGT